MKNNITYHKEGDYFIPDLAMKKDNKNYHIGKYGNLRLKFLKEHRRGFYTELMMVGELQNHLSDVDEVASKIVLDTIKKLAEQEGINEDLKATNQMEWVQAMNNIKNRAEEIVLKKLIYV
jgi:hypothetical protein